MEQVLRALKRTDAERRIPLLRREIDEELAKLHDAIMCEDLETIEACKERLEALRREMLLLEL